MPGPVSTVSHNGTLIFGFALAVGAVTVGVWGAKGTRGLNGSRTRRRRELHGRRTIRKLHGFGDAHAQRELVLYIENDGDLYRQQLKPIQKNLVTKVAKGVYDRAKAEQLWMYLVENGAKKYVHEFSSDDQPWHVLFPIDDRRAVAKELNDDFLANVKHGEYDYLLPKKYQKKA